MGAIRRRISRYGASGTPTGATSHNAGQFNKRVRIEREDRSVRDNAGGYKLGWALVPGCASVPAKIYYPPPSKRDEKLDQQQMQARTIAQITIRYRPSLNIDASMRVLYGNREFNIRSVITTDEAQQVIVLQCEELQAQGSKH